MNLRKLCYHLGFTKETRVELSDLIRVSAVVKEKIHIPNNDSLIYLGIPCESHLVIFKTDNGDITVDNPSTFYQFEVNDRVKLNYMDRYLEVFDYIPPNFGEKQLIAREQDGIDFVSAYTDTVYVTCQKQPDVPLIPLDVDHFP